MNTLARKHWFPVLLLPLMLTSCTGAKEYDTLQAQVAQQNQTTQQLNMQLSGVQPALADTWSQLQSLRQEVASLRGEVDTLSHAFTQVGGAQGMADTLARHDRALRLLETQLAMDLQLNEAAAPMGAPATPGVPGAPGAPGAVGALGAGSAGLGQAGGVAPGTTPVTAPPAGNASVQQPAPTAPAAPTTAASPAKPASTDTAQALYDNGMAAFNNRQYPQAQKSFTDFTTTYPQHKLVSNAWFWQGESNYQQKNYAAAALSYEKVISGFPNSNKAPASYLKQAMSFIQLKKNDAARERLNQLMQKYPKAPEATRAKQVLASLK